MPKKKVQSKSGLTKKATSAMVKLPLDVILGKSPRTSKISQKGIFTKGK